MGILEVIFQIFFLVKPKPASKADLYTAYIATRCVNDKMVRGVVVVVVVVAPKKEGRSISNEGKE